MASRAPTNRLTLPSSDYAALIAQGRQGFLATIADQEATADRLQLRAAGETLLAKAADSDADRAAHLLAATTFTARAAASRAMAGYNRAVVERVEAAWAQREAA